MLFKMECISTCEMISIMLRTACLRGGLGMETTLSAGGRERMATRAVAAATIGTALEWFDFTLYGAVSATVLPKLFFPTMDPTAALLASLATFGVGLGARPLGAIVCGYLGDKLGRRNLL